MDWVQLSQATMRKVYFLPLSPQEFLVLISSTSEGWKAESVLESPCGFEPRISGLEIQRKKGVHKMVRDTLKVWQDFPQDFELCLTILWTPTRS